MLLEDDDALLLVRVRAAMTARAVLSVGLYGWCGTPAGM
jgi:hypothetical protein